MEGFREHDIGPWGSTRGGNLSTVSDYQYDRNSEGPVTL